MKNTTVRKMTEPYQDQIDQPVPPNCTDLEKDLLGTVLIMEGAMGKIAHKIESEDFTPKPIG